MVFPRLRVLSLILQGSKFMRAVEVAVQWLQRECHTKKYCLCENNACFGRGLLHSATMSLFSPF